MAFATAAKLNGFSTYSFPYTRKPTLLRKLQSTLDLIAFIFSHRAVVKRRSIYGTLLSYLKVPKCEIFDPFFFTPINPIWVGDLRTGGKKIFFEDYGRYSPFCFFTQTEPALKICLRRLSLR